ncbi:response regulator [soil metagenome]
MINILFVDDEPNILDGLQRMLRSMRHEWNMLFAQSGFDALRMMSEQPIDVIVSDMKMPGMDGAQLFQTVSESYPHVVRIILSGYSEKEINMRSVGTAHQYLSKPCDSEGLKATITRVCALRDLLTDENLRRLVSQLPTVPSLPMLYHELVDELGKEESSAKKVGEIVKQDIGMTVKILQIVNSAFFGLRRRISDSCEAVEFLGLDMIGSLTLGLGVISQFESHTSGIFFADLWAHSIAVGVMANKIAAAENRERANDAFTAGLLHDIGKVVLAVNLPEKFSSVTQLVKQENISITDAERYIFDSTHAEVGAYLLGLWGLPTQVVQAVAFHQVPSESQTDDFSPLTAVHVANAVQEYMALPDTEKVEPKFDLEYLEHLGLLGRIPEWQEIYADMPVLSV